MNEKPKVDVDTIFQSSARESLVKVIPLEAPPPSLFHYTSAEGLLGIISHNTLRFSDTRFLNDGSEVFYGYSIFETALVEFMKDKPEEELLAAENLKETIREQILSYRTFIFCMSAENNLLNQWRDYGKDIVTYSIELDTATMLTQNYFNFNAVLFRLIYNREKQIEIMTLLLKTLYEKFKGAGDIDDEDVLHGITNAAAHEITWLIYQFKNPAFEAEKEWRFTTFEGQFDNATSPGFRASALGVVPFYDWKRKGDVKTLPIKSVTVGPSPYAQIADLGLKTFLTKNGYSDNTHYSLIPIRR